MRILCLAALLSVVCSAPGWSQPPAAERQVLVGCRQEILLERAPAAKVISILQGQFKKLEFIPHPTMNGFYVVGPRDDILTLKRSIPELDVVPPEGEESMIRESIQIHYGDLDEVLSLVETLVPDVSFHADARESTLILEGSAANLEIARELLQQLDQPLDQVILECKLVRVAETVRQNLRFEWDERNWTAQVVNAEPAPLRLGVFKRNQPSESYQPSSQASVLAGPGICLQTDQPGEVHVGDRLPLVVDQDVGLKLRSTFSIHGDGSNLDCKLHGEFTIPLELLGNQHPRERKLTFDGEIPMKDGETTVVEGLLTPEIARQAVTAIPLLADLPVLGHLFRELKGGESFYLMLTPNVIK